MRTAPTMSPPTLLQALNDAGWTIPAQAACYWVGEAMHKTDFKDLPKVPENVQGLAGILAANAVHLANLLKAHPYPGSAASPRERHAPLPAPRAQRRPIAERLFGDAQADARPRGAALGCRRDDPAVPRRIARQMAPRPHDMVFRDLRAARSCARLPAVR